jgi:hypothetical protein
MKTFLLILALSLTVFSQELPSSYEYNRSINEKAKLPMYYLAPRTEATNDAGLKGMPFAMLGAMVQPELNLYALLFLNAKEQYQLHLQKAKGATITIDGKSFNIKTYTSDSGDREIIGKLRMESAKLFINKTIYEKLIKSNNVSIRVGTVKYKLDRDNIDAFRYLANQIEQNTEAKARK